MRDLVKKRIAQKKGLGNGKSVVRDVMGRIRCMPGGRKNCVRKENCSEREGWLRRWTLAYGKNALTKARTWAEMPVHEKGALSEEYLGRVRMNRQVGEHTTEMPWDANGSPKPLGSLGNSDSGDRCQEDAVSICSRFVTGGMSLGALSREAHEVIALGMSLGQVVPGNGEIGQLAHFGPSNPCEMHLKLGVS